MGPGRSLEYVYGIYMGGNSPVCTHTQKTPAKSHNPGSTWERRDPDSLYSAEYGYYAQLVCASARKALSLPPTTSTAETACPKAGFLRRPFALLDGSSSNMLTLFLVELARRLI